MMFRLISYNSVVPSYRNKLYLLDIIPCNTEQQSENQINGATDIR